MKSLLICFDVDGTLIDDTVFIWQTIHEKINTDKNERDFWSAEYWNKRITYDEWARKDVEMWIKMGATRTSLKSTISDLKPMKGAFDTLNILKKSGHQLGVISGSLDIAFDKAFPNNEKLFDCIYLNKLQFDSEGYLKGIQSTPFDIEHKATGLKKMAEENNFEMKNTVFIGDNFNDVEVAKIAGCSIAFNCKSDQLARVSDYVIEKKDLREIIPIIHKFAIS